MDRTFTLKDYIRLKNDESDIFGTVESRQVTAEYEPSKRVLDNILNYSKALSIRESRYVENIKVVLN